MAVIEVQGLRKSYGDVEAVRGIDFTVEEGEVVAVLGPNGAGKTTMVEILEGYRSRDAGRVQVLGFDPADGGLEYRQEIGIVLQTAAVEPYLTVREVLAMYAEPYRRPRDLDEVISLAGLAEKATSRVKTLSGGQQRRLDLAIGLVGDPRLVFLDEPTTGFDPAARRQAWDVVRSLCQLGKTVLLTTHYMDEAQALADRVMMIVRGEIVAQGTPDEIGGRADADAQIRFVLPAGVSPADVPMAVALEDDGVVRVDAAHPTAVLHELTAWALARGDELSHLTVSRPSLEDVYLELIDRPSTEAGP